MSAALHLIMPDADVWLYRGFFAPAESSDLFESLLTSLPWEQKTIRFFGRHVRSPRLTTWHGDPGKVYRYSGITNIAEPWTMTLLAIKGRLDALAGVTFNSVLANLYRDGQDSIGWHSDNEYDLGKLATIGSVSFGATRSLHFRHKQNKALREKVDLGHGDVLLMRGTTQEFWEHQVPKSARCTEARINLTFRVVIAG
jgi:alkylated DNA repair dioxygenase AlkB